MWPLGLQPRAGPKRWLRCYGSMRSATSRYRFSLPSNSGLAVSNEARDQIATGDVTGMVLAVISLVALHYRVRWAPVLIWALVAETIFDLVNATAAGIHEGLFATASGVTWLILTFYVPLLWVSLGLIIWQLYARRHVPLAMAVA